jgi:hypothetical protein
MVAEIRNATQAELEEVTREPLHEYKKTYPVEMVTGWCKSLYIYDELIAVGGIITYWTGVGECWLQLGAKAADHKIEVVRQVKRMIATGFDELHLHRLQATERADFDQTIKFAEHLGFKKEGCMLRYTADGADAYLYAIVKGD